MYSGYNIEVMGKCKRCGLKTVLSEQDIERMVNEVRSMRGIKTVQDDVYQSRLNACFDCPKLEYGSTCALCGCVVHVRALLSDGKCPFPKNTRWQV